MSATDSLDRLPYGHSQILLAQPKLKMTDFDIQLAEQMHLDKSPRQNAEIALKQLADIDQTTARKADNKIKKIANVVVGPFPAAVLDNKIDFEKRYDDYLEGLSNQPVLEQYRDPKTLNFEVPMNPKLVESLLEPRNLNSHWQFFSSRR